MKTGEQWLPIKGYEEYYEISNHGNLRSLGRVYKTRKEVVKYLNGKPLSPGLTKKGYYSIRLWNIRSGRSYYIHRLVAEAFIPNPNNYPMVNHKDCNKQNNYYENLEWCTAQYNNTYGELSVNKMKPVDQFDIKGNFIKRYGSMKEASEELNVDPDQIGSVCMHKRNTSRGYRWEYADRQPTVNKNINELTGENLSKILMTLEEKLDILLSVEAERIKGGVVIAE